MLATFTVTLSAGSSDVPHEQEAPLTTFSVAAVSQSQAPADFLPHEQVASAAQAQLPPDRPQQVLGTDETGADMMGG